MKQTLRQKQKLSLNLTLNLQKQIEKFPAKDLQCMVLSAKQLIDDLGGQMQTEQGEPFTAEVYQSYLEELGISANA